MHTGEKIQDLVFFYPNGHEAHFEYGHPERPERITAIVNALDKAGYWQAYPHLEPEIPSEKLLTAIHAEHYLKVLAATAHSGGHLDMNTYTRKESWDLALRTAGGAISCAAAVWDGEARRAFALTRPPGHHATTRQGMGFCLLNSAALAAQYLIDERGAGRVAIIDLDLHHGNGTQDIFWQRGDVFYVSTHQAPLYPGTGHLSETGTGEGEGTTANFPFPPSSGDLAYSTCMQELILPLLEGYKPEMLLISYGFDPHWRDPLGHLKLSAGGLRGLIASLSEWAERNCNGRMALVLEGGYDLDAAGACALAAVSGMLSTDFEDPLGKDPRPEGNSWQHTLSEAKIIWNL